VGFGRAGITTYELCFALASSIVRPSTTDSSLGWRGIRHFIEGSLCSAVRAWAAIDFNKLPAFINVESTERFPVNSCRESRTEKSNEKSFASTQ